MYSSKLRYGSSRLAHRIAKSLAENMPAQSSGAARGTGESVGEHEEAKVHLDLPSLMKGRALAIAHSFRVASLAFRARAYLWTR